MYKYLLTFSFFTYSFLLFSQDIHFSQFDVNVLAINPGYAGVMQRDFRIANNYRNQWGSVGLPYSTFSVAYDMNTLKQRPFKRGLTDLGVGFSFSQDKVGTSNWSQNQFGLTLSAIQEVAKDTRMSLGLQTIYAQNSIIIDNLTWDNQFADHQFDENLPSREQFANSSKSYLDVSAGLLLESRASEQEVFTAGIAYYHANQPVYTIFSQEKLPSKKVIYVSYETPIGGKLSARRIIPKLMYASQGKHKEILVGALYRSVMKQASEYTTFANETYIDFGSYIRFRDAMIFVMGIDFKNFRLGLSYDVNISKFTQATKTRGGFEFSLTYKGFFSDNRTKLRKV